MDTIAEFLNVVRNARKAGHDKVDIAASGMRKGMAEILKRKDTSKTTEWLMMVSKVS